MTEVTVTCTHEQRVNVRQIQDPPWLIREMCTWCSAEILTNQMDPPMTTPLTLAEFLLARIAEDEKAATSRWSRGVLDPEASNIEKRYTYARVLAECGAKRQIVALHEAVAPDVNVNTSGYAPEGSPVCRHCGEPEWYCVGWPCPTLRFLALPYADHPDFREEWQV